MAIQVEYDLFALENLILLNKLLWLSWYINLGGHQDYCMNIDTIQRCITHEAREKSERYYTKVVQQIYHQPKRQICCANCLIIKSISPILHILFNQTWKKTMFSESQISAKFIVKCFHIKTSFHKRHSLLCCFRVFWASIFINIISDMWQNHNLWFFYSI